MIPSQPRRRSPSTSLNIPPTSASEDARRHVLSGDPAAVRARSMARSRSSRPRASRRGWRGRWIARCGTSSPNGTRDPRSTSRIGSTRCIRRSRRTVSTRSSTPPTRAWCPPITSSSLRSSAVPIRRRRTRGFSRRSVRRCPPISTRSAAVTSKRCQTKSPSGSRGSIRARPSASRSPAASTADPCS